MTSLNKTIQKWIKNYNRAFPLLMYISCPFIGLNLKAAMSEYRL